jgi:surface polysaccharide O-acyltransferase-like enzyme
MVTAAQLAPAPADAPEPAPPPSPGPRELLVYQLPLIKGICIALVVLTHVASEYSKMTAWSWLTGALLAGHGLARFAVPCFVLLSGFYLSLNPRNERARPFYRRTLKYLLAPYAVYSVIYWLASGSRDPWELVWDLGTGSAWGHLWFMALIVQFYLVHPFLARWYRRCTWRGTLVLLALALQTAYALPFEVWVPGTAHFSGVMRLIVRLGRLCFLTHVGFFLGGYWLLEHADAALRLTRRPAAVVAAALLWLGTGVATAVQWAIPLSHGLATKIPHAYVLHRLVTPFMCAGALVTLVALCARRNSRLEHGRAFLSSLGLHAYGVYYLHPLGLWLGGRALTNWAGITADSLLYFALIFPFTLLVTLGAVRLAAQTPAARYVG